MTVKHALLAGIFAAMPVGVVLAQSLEAEWRVISEITPTTVPSLTSPLENPFPTVPIVEEPVVEEPQLDQEEIANQQKSEIIEEGRKLISNGQAYTPSVESVRFNGYINGQQGKKVLYQGSWLTEGQSIQVPVQEGARATSVLERLQALDANMAQSLEQEISQSMSHGHAKLKIRSISDKKVVLTDGKVSYDVKLSDDDLRDAP